MQEFGADIRHAVRQMRRQCTFTVTVVLTLGLGIGATVALLSVANALLVRPLPYAHEDRIRVFWMDFDWRGEEYASATALQASARWSGVSVGDIVRRGVCGSSLLIRTR
jgi:hypothetical protein